MAETLTPVVVQDVRTNNVLMVAWTNRRALARTRKTKKMHFWSRSRKKLWKKGETSGNELRLVSLHKDCDGDTILARVIPEGPACHRNTYSCFADREFRARGVLDELEAVIAERKKKGPAKAYTTQLLRNPERRMKKFLEEAAELVLASLRKKKKEMVLEGADVLYHALVLLNAGGVKLEDLEVELEQRVRHREKGSKRKRR